jgi:transcriptional regulator with XRE-family HTH domain
MPFIIPARIKLLREARGKSRDALLKQYDRLKDQFKDEQKISKRTLLRLENKTTERENIQEGTFNALVKLLRVDPRILTGELELTDDLVYRQRHEPRQDAPVPQSQPEVFETRLVKFDEKFVIVEFSDADPTGRVIARDIVDEAAGLRLSSYSKMRKALLDAYGLLCGPDIETAFAERFVMDAIDLADEWDAYLRRIADALGMERSPPITLNIDEWHAGSKSEMELSSVEING